MMKWKKYSDELPREEHGWVLTKPVERQHANDAFPWNWHPHDHGKDPCDIEWLDHLDDGWIPASERKPTKEDGCPDGPMRGYVYAQLSDGVFSRVIWNALSFNDGTIIAWRRLPAPYVPPSPPLWESDEDRDSVIWMVNSIGSKHQSLGRSLAETTDAESVARTIQELLRKRGYAIRKLEGE